MLKKKQTCTHIVGRTLATSQENTKKKHLFFLHWQKKQHIEFQTVSLFLFKTELSDCSASIISSPMPAHCRSQRTGGMQTC